MTYLQFELTVCELSLPKYIGDVELLISTKKVPSYPATIANSLSLSEWLQPQISLSLSEEKTLFGMKANKSTLLQG